MWTLRPVPGAGVMGCDAAAVAGWRHLNYCRGELAQMTRPCTADTRHASQYYTDNLSGHLMSSIYIM